eukprot:scaffold871_cov130-Cylindrotheca_fusiformis.AAC.11
MHFQGLLQQLFANHEALAKSPHLLQPPQLIVDVGSGNAVIVVAELSSQNCACQNHQCSRHRQSSPGRHRLQPYTWWAYEIVDENYYLRLTRILTKTWNFALWVTREENGSRQHFHQKSDGIFEADHHPQNLRLASLYCCSMATED